MMKSIFGLLIVAAIFMSTACHAATHISDDLGQLKTECIGRYQINVPSEVEVIFRAPRSLSTISMDALKSLRSNPYPATFSQYHYDGELGITPEVPKTDFEHLRKKIKTGLIAGKKRFLKETLKDKKETLKYKDKYPSLVKSSLEEIDRRKGPKSMDYDTPIKFGWGLPYPTIYLYQNNRIFTYDEASHGDDEEVKKQIEKQFNSVLNDLRPRTLYEVPKQPGVCIPYGFIADDGTAPRDIGVTMRLIDHPEVEIFFRDTSGTLNDYEPKKEIEYFWTIMYQKYTKLTEADFWGYRSIKMGGQKGKGMLATIHRYDGSIDYGYIAVTKSPSQMLYVIRTAARAKGKPVGIDDIKNIAEKIMASVKPHAVQ